MAVDQDQFCTNAVIDLTPVETFIEYENKKYFFHPAFLTETERVSKFHLYHNVSGSEKQ